MKKKDSVNPRDIERGSLPIVFNQKNVPVLLLKDSSKRAKAVAAQQLREEKKRQRAKGVLHDTAGKSTIINIISSGKFCPGNSRHGE